LAIGKIRNKRWVTLGTCRRTFANTIGLVQYKLVGAVDETLAHIGLGIVGKLTDAVTAGTLGLCGSFGVERNIK